MWDNLSLNDVEDEEMEIQNHAWEEGTNRGKTCLAGKLSVDRIVSKEVIQSTLIQGWKPTRTSSFKVLGDNLFFVDFENREGQGSSAQRKALGF